MTSERRKQIRKRRKQKNKNRFVQWFKALSKGKKAALIIGVIVLLLIIAAVLFVMSKFAKLDTQKIDKEKIQINQFEEDDVGVGYTNFVLFGGDSRKGNVDKDLNTDTIIVVSLNNETKEVKLVSVYRDTLLDVAKGSIQKCNSAYARGGATQAINMLNMNLDLDIRQYVTVNWKAVTDVVDMLGGVEIDVLEAEWKAVNLYIDETAMVSGKKTKHLTHAGVQTLDGVQAVTYARIRKGVGDDYARTARQRLIIQKTVEKAMKADFGTLNRIIDKVFPQVSTNLTMTEILKYAKDLTKYKIGETSGFPFEKGGAVIPGRGDSVFPITLKKNVSLLHKFLYGTEDYQPSSKVVSISGAIANLVGNRQVEPNTNWNGNGGNGTGTGTGTEGGNGTGTGTGTEGGSGTGTGTGTEGGSGTGTGTGTEGGSGTGTGTGTEGGSGTGTGTGTEGGSGTGTGTGTEGGSGTGTGTGTEGGSGTGTGTGTEGGSGTGTGTEGGTGTGSEQGENNEN